MTRTKAIFLTLGSAFLTLIGSTLIRQPKPTLTAALKKSNSIVEDVRERTTECIGGRKS